MDVRFVASVSPIVRDAGSARHLYSGVLGLPLEGSEGDYVFTERIDGLKHLGLWPLADAARACFGTAEWPAAVPIPQASVEFEVDDVAAAAGELERAGYRLLHGPRTEPWSQVTARLLTPDGLLLAVCFTPWLRPAGSTPTREAFWQAVDAAAAVLADPRLAARWDRPSALPDMTVGDLAAHLVRAVTTVVHYLDLPAPTGDPLSPAAYYVAVLGEPGDRHSPQSRAVRERAHHDAAAGHGQVRQRWEEAVSQAGDRLAGTPPDRLVAVAGGLVLSVDDYLVTRVVELALHADDLAFSLGVEPPQPPPAVAVLAEHVLLDIARQRHGDTAVLRALARGERAPAVFPAL